MCRSISMVNLLDLVDPNLLARLQNTFSRTTGLSSIIVSIEEHDGGRWLTEPTRCSELCRAIRRNRRGERSCLISDIDHAAQAAAEKKTISYTCHCGLVDFCAPIFVAGTPVAAIFGGQLIFRDDEQESRKTIRTNASKYIPRSQLDELLSGVRTVGKREFTHLLDGVSAMAQSISELATERYGSNLLQELIIVTGAARNVDEMSDRILATSKEAIPSVTSGSISLRGPADNRFYPRAYFGDFPMGTRYPFGPGEGYIGTVAERHKPLLINNVREKRQVQYKYQEIIDGRKIASLLAIPLMAYPQRRLVGVLELASQKLNSFNNEHVRLLSAAGQVAAGLIQRTLEWECISAIERSKDKNEMLEIVVNQVPRSSTESVVPSSCSIRRETSSSWRPPEDCPTISQAELHTVRVKDSRDG